MNPHPDLTRRAAHILRDLGLPAAVLTPVESYSSAVWLTPEDVVSYHT